MFMLESEYKTQATVRRVAVVGQRGRTQSGLGKTMLHVIRKLIQLTIIENKWGINGNICWKTI